MISTFPDEGSEPQRTEEIAQSPGVGVSRAGPRETRALQDYRTQSHVSSSLLSSFIQATLPENSPQILYQKPQDTQQAQVFTKMWLDFQVFGDEKKIESLHEERPCHFTVPSFLLSLAGPMQLVNEYEVQTGS